MAKLEHLTVANFRGASTKLHLDFDKSKPLTVIFGENGTGKSTIADALDAIGNGSAGSLADRSSVTPKNHLPTIGKTSRDIQIELKADGQLWKATVGRDGIPSAPNPRPKIRVLRRAPLLAMVNAQPARRYEELKRFIDVQRIEMAESTLKDAFSTAKRKVELAEEQRRTAEAHLRDVWTKEGRPGLGPIEWAESVVSADAAALTAKAKSLRQASCAIHDAHQRLVDLEATSVSVAETKKGVAEVEADVLQLPSANGETVMALTGLLRSVANFLATGAREDKCPVCEQAVAVDQLRADIQVRLQNLAPYEAVREKRNTAANAVQSIQQAALSQRDKLLLAARPLIQLLTKADLLPIVALKLEPTAYAELAKTESFDADLAASQARSLIDLLVPAAVALDDEEEAEKKRAGQISAVDTLKREYGNSLSESGSMEQIQGALDAALAIVRKTRIEYTQEILDAVSGECNRLYSAIHPNESVAITKLELDPEKRASLTQKAVFQGHADVTPQGYFSESHLDTLAFCFWLALTKREFPNREAVLVLDDVFTSVDSQHIRRIADLIVEESQHFAHVLVTTHQRLWRDCYRNPHGAGKRTQLIELQRWALAKGVSSYKDQAGRG